MGKSWPVSALAARTEDFPDHYYYSSHPNDTHIVLKIDSVLPFTTFSWVQYNDSML